MQYLGKHLMIDGLIAPTHIQAGHDSAIGVKFLEGIVHEIDMTMILPAMSVHFPHAVSEMDRILKGLEATGFGNIEVAQKIRENLRYRVEQAFGYSSFLMIAESHMSLHTFPEEGFVTFDCYSCKDFDHDLILRHWEATFGVAAKTVNIVSRRIPRADG